MMRIFDLPTDLQEHVMRTFVSVARDDKQSLAAARLVCTQFRCMFAAVFAGGIAARSLPTPQWLLHLSCVADIDLRQADTTAMSSQEWKQMASLRPDLTRSCLPIHSLEDPIMHLLSGQSALKELKLASDFDEIFSSTHSFDGVYTVVAAPNQPWNDPDAMDGWEGCCCLNAMFNTLEPLRSSLTRLHLQDLRYATVVPHSAPHLHGITALTGLQSLKLKGIKLVGNSGLAHVSQRCGAITELCLSNCSWIRAENVLSFTALRHLKISCNCMSRAQTSALSGDALAQLTHLLSLNLSGVPLPTGGKWLRNLVTLQDLVLDLYPTEDSDTEDSRMAYASFHQDFAQWQSASGLRRLHLIDHDYLTEDLLLDVCNRFTVLTELNLSRSSQPFTDRACETMRTTLVNLHTLGTKEYAGSAAGLASLAQLPALRRWDLSWMQVIPGDNQPLDLTPLQLAGRLTKLDISAYDVRHGSRGLASGLQALSHLPQLQALALQHNRLPLAAMEAVAGASSLTHLDLENSRVDDAAMLPLSRLRQLQHLTVRNCRPLTAGGLEPLFLLPCLRYVDVRRSGQQPAAPWPVPSQFAHPFMRLHTGSYYASLSAQ